MCFLTEILKLERNVIVGSVPASIGNLVNLKELFAQGNLMTGSIPTELVNLINLDKRL
jgi:Leucine-rich repeat (LRR) protein